MAGSRSQKQVYTIFVGNISYDTTEEQLKQKFSEVGHVVSFRLNYDRETGKPKGFGFCEYDDKEVAMSAIRNLNGELINGRAVRVDFAEQDKQLQGVTPTSNSKRSGGSSSSRPQVQPGPQAPLLPEPLMGPQPTIAALPLKEVHEIMVQVKAAVLSNPVELRALLVANPQICHALLQGQILLGMVPIPSQAQASAPSQQARMASPPQMGVGSTPSMAPSSSMPGPQNTPSIPPAAPASQGMPGGMPYSQTPGSMPMPGTAGPQMPAPMDPSLSQRPPPGMQPSHPMPAGHHPQQAYMQLAQQGQQIPPQGQQMPHRSQQEQQIPQQGHPAAAGGIDQQQAAVLQHIMQLTPQQIEQLPPEQRSKVMILRQKVQQQIGHSQAPGQGPGQAAPGQYM